MRSVAVHVCITILNKQWTRRYVAEISLARLRCYIQIKQNSSRGLFQYSIGERVVVCLTLLRLDLYRIQLECINMIFIAP